ncbi:hypothetical protein [Thermomonas carbonis]|uniref:Uncharacterized protein n=1 Tax=Thermomonas carbonis TaxID=1463158 RepID=A0A7G9SNM0_9GAMM|nr:hypothetical protein [Thermomonas carbonis]QNN69445.1 hypothetical protein H9L16_12270 [Thermomonas carbonis]
MSGNEPQVAWEFNFAIEQDGGGLITVDQANEFMGAIVVLAEARGLQIGGGYSAYKASSEPLFPLRPE